MQTICKTIILIICSLLLTNCGSKNLEETAPYNSVINKTIISVEETILAKNKNKQFNQDYPKRLETLAYEGTSQANHITIPIGSKFNFTKVVHYKDPISLIKTAFIFGEVTAKDTGKTYKIQYRWAHFKLMCKTDPCHYWEYRKAPWQNEVDTTMYFE